jgi:Uncharacterized protein conserved in bacteria (DUF2171)
MFKSLDLQKDMEVVGLEGNHVGTVDHLEAADRNRPIFILHIRAFEWVQESWCRVVGSRTSEHQQHGGSASY